MQACCSSEGARDKGSAVEPGPTGAHLPAATASAGGAVSAEVAAVRPKERQGQTAKAVYTYRLLCAGTLEEVIYQRQQAKLDLGGSIRDGELSASDAASMLGENARLLSAERGSWSTLFKGLEPQCLSAPRELGLHLETASHEGSVSHIHIKRRTSA